MQHYDLQNIIDMRTKYLETKRQVWSFCKLLLPWYRQLVASPSLLIRTISNKLLVTFHQCFSAFYSKHVKPSIQSHIIFSMKANSNYFSFNVFFLMYLVTNYFAIKKTLWKFEKASGLFQLGYSPKLNINNS